MPRGKRKRGDWSNEPENERKSEGRAEEVARLARIKQRVREFQDLAVKEWQTITDTKHYHYGGHDGNNFFVRSWTPTSVYCLARSRNCEGCKVVQNTELVKSFDNQTCFTPYAVQLLINAGVEIPEFIYDKAVGTFG